MGKKECTQEEGMHVGRRDACTCRAAQELKISAAWMQPHGCGHGTGIGHAVGCPVGWLLLWGGGEGHWHQARAAHGVGCRSHSPAPYYLPSHLSSLRAGRASN